MIKQNQNILTANGQVVPIVGVKNCLIQINNCSCSIQILIVKDLVKACIIGMDFIMKFPPTNQIINELKKAITNNTGIIKIKENKTNNEKAKINNASETKVQHQQTVETKQEKLIESNRDEIKKTIRYPPQCQLNRLKHQDIENQPTLKDVSVNTDHGF